MKKILLGIAIGWVAADLVAIYTTTHTAPPPPAPVRHHRPARKFPVTYK